MSREYIKTQKDLVSGLARQLEHAKKMLESTIRTEAVAYPEGWLVLVDNSPYQDDRGGEQRFQRAKIFPLTTAGAYGPAGFMGLNAPITTISMSGSGAAILVGENYDQEAVEYLPIQNGEEGNVLCALAFFTTDRKEAEAWQRAEAVKIQNEHPDVTVLLLEEGVES